MKGSMGPHDWSRGTSFYVLASLNLELDKMIGGRKLDGIFAGQVKGNPGARLGPHAPWHFCTPSLGLLIKLLNCALSDCCMLTVDHLYHETLFWSQMSHEKESQEAGHRKRKRGQEGQAEQEPGGPGVR